MTPEELDVAAFGIIPCMAADPEVSRAVRECYVPLREAGYEVRDARFAAAGFLGASWGMRRVEEEVAVLLGACEMAEEKLAASPADTTT